MKHTGLFGHFSSLEHLDEKDQFYVFITRDPLEIQSTLVISNSKGLSEALRDIRTSYIRFIKLRKKKFEQPHLTNLYVIGLLKI